jgi:hypothetical protein
LALNIGYEQEGDIAKAIDQQEKQAIIYGEDAQKAKQEFAAVRREFAARGERAYWLSREKSLAASSGTDPFGTAVVQARLGETDATYANLEKAYEQRSTSMLYWIQMEPAFDRLRSESRFQDLLRRIVLPR